MTKLTLLLATMLSMPLPTAGQDALVQSRVVVYPATATVEVGSTRRLAVVEEAYNAGGKTLSAR